MRLCANECPISLRVFIRDVHMQVLPETTSSTLSCRCSHLSDFAGRYFVPPNNVNLLDPELYKNITHNYVVLALVLSAWLLHLCLSLWAYAADRKDRHKVGIHIFHCLAVRCSAFNIFAISAEMLLCLRESSQNDQIVYPFFPSLCVNLCHPCVALMQLAPSNI